MTTSPFRDLIVNLLWYVRDSGRKVEDPDMLEQIRLTIIDNLLKYHPVSCTQILNMLIGVSTVFETHWVVVTRYHVYVPCTFCSLSQAFNCMFLLYIFLPRNLVNDLQWERLLVSKLQLRRWLLQKTIIFLFPYKFLFLFFIGSVGILPCPFSFVFSNHFFSLRDFCGN